MEEVRVDFRNAVKAAIVDYKFGDPEGLSYLQAANIQPIRPTQVIPKLGVVDLKALPLGRYCTRIPADSDDQDNTQQVRGYRRGVRDLCEFAAGI